MTNEELQERLLARLPYVDDTGEISPESGVPFGDLYAFVSRHTDSPPSPRTVRRVLSNMSEYVGHTGHTRGARWFKVQDTVMLRSDRRMNANLAIALCALDRVAAQQLPAAVFAELASTFAQARATLALDRNNERAVKGRSWSKKVTRIAGTPPLVFPTLAPDVYRSVTDALLRERKLTFKYNKPDGATKVARTYKNHSPLGLVDRAGVFYMITREPTKGEMRMFRVDRILEATVLTDAVAPPDGFDLDAYAKNTMNFLHEPEVELKLRIHSGDGEHSRTAAGHMLNEFKLHDDQRIEWDKDGNSFVLTATVAPSVMLRQFLHSQSDSIEVLAPASLRAEFAARARRMAERYARDHRKT
jgi:predicted DNA-binding transcriptional regulator YafY